MKKKVLIPIIIMILLFATATTAFATINTCILYPSNRGEVKTAKLTANYFHGAGYNKSYSDDKMIYKLQVYRGKWKKVDVKELRPNQYYATPTLYSNPAMRVRTKLWSKLGEGGVSGVGSVCDF